MTEEQINGCFEALGRAFAERRELRTDTEKLVTQLGAYVDAVVTLIDNPTHADSLETIKTVGDAGAALERMLRNRERLAELDKILS